MSNPCRLFMQHVTIGLFLLCITSPLYATGSSLGDKNYVELRDMLPLYQNAVLHPWPTLPQNTLLKLGSHSRSIILLKERLRATGDMPVNDDDNTAHFDENVFGAVKNFQLRHGLKPDGVVGPHTIAELNIPAEVRVRQIEVNMQRWASLAPHLGDRFVMVNVPDFHLYLFDHNQEVMNMKAIVGKPDRQTPEISSTITRIVLNPPWNVPEMIAEKDVIPKAMQDPNYLYDMHIKIYDSEESNAEQINPDNIDWNSPESIASQYHFRQDPGTDNALGLVKFEFQNKEHVYLHDTPAKDLFDQDMRTFSSGCIRLEKPFELLTYLMQDNPSWDYQHQEDVLVEGKTKYVKTPRPMPIFITYITAWVDENGMVNFRDDIYGKDDPSASMVPSEEMDGP